MDALSGTPRALGSLAQYLSLRDLAALSRTSKSIRDGIAADKLMWAAKARLLGLPDEEDPRAAVRRAVASRSAALNGLLSGATRAAWLEDSTAAATAKVDELATLRGLAKVVGAPAEDLARLEDTIVEFETLTVVRFGAAYDAKSESAMRDNYAVLARLGFGKMAVQQFLARHPLFMDVESVLPSTTLSGETPEEVAAFVTAFLDKLAPMMESQHNLIGDVFGADAAPIRLLFVERVFEQTVSEHLGFALQTANKDSATYLKTLQSVFTATKKMLDQMDWQAMYPTNPEARKQEVLECSFMGRLGSYLRMEEEWMFTSFRGHLLKTTFANDAVKAKMFESFDRCVRSHERSEHYDLSSQLVGSVPSTVPSTPVTGASSGQSSTLFKSLVLPDLISVVMALDLKHIAEASLKRSQTVRLVSQSQFVHSYETLFSVFVDLMTGCLLRPALELAISVMETVCSPDAPPSLGPAELVTIARELSTGFFDLAHMADLLQQTVQALYEQLVEPQLTPAGAEVNALPTKKRFERVLDELVAGGIDKSIGLLMWRVGRILDSEQGKDDFTNPPKMVGTPSKAAKFAVDIVTAHAEAVSRYIDDSVREALLNEIGSRFFQHIIMHLKHFTVSAEGAPQLTIDLAHYGASLTKLNASKDGRLQAGALKVIGDLFVMSAEALVSTLEAAESVEGVDLFSPEDLRAFVRNRADYRKIAWTVDGAQNCTIF